MKKETMVKRHKLHRIWKRMHARCHNPSNAAYPFYGRRGIGVCPQWNDFQAFYLWALHHGYDPSNYLERIDFNGDYCPENCRWAMRAKETAKKKTFYFRNEDL